MLEGGPRLAPASALASKGRGSFVPGRLFPALGLGAVGGPAGGTGGAGGGFPDGPERESAALCLNQASTLEQHVSGLNGELFCDNHYGNGRVTTK